MITSIKLNDSKNELTVCYAPKMVISRGIWKGENPLKYSFPVFILQLLLIVITSRLLHFFLKRFRQPRVVAEIIAGMILGPSVLGRISTYHKAVFPLRSVVVLETMANVGLVYFLFLIGVEMDLSNILRTRRKTFAIAFAGILFPFIIGCFSSILIVEESSIMIKGSYILFLTVAFSVTAFPVLARILAELKLLNMEIGKLAMSSALINDLCAWVLLTFAIALSDNKVASFNLLWVILSSTIFFVSCIFVVRPAIRSLIMQTPDGETFSEFSICIILTGVIISAFVTDSLGMHAAFGAFIYGLIIPNGPLGVTLIEKLEDFVTGILLPLFFANSGLKTKLGEIKASFDSVMLLIIILLSCAGKVGGTVLVCLYYKMPISEALTLGILVNTKGLIEIIILNVAKDTKILDESSYAIMVITAVVMTALTAPIVTTTYRPVRKYLPYKWRAIQGIKQDAELPILVCIHNPRNVPTVINLLEASCSTKKSALYVYVLHLVELTDRASTMLIVHGPQKANRPALNQTQAQSDHMFKAFKNFEQHVGYVSVQTLTAISPYSTMHEDICNLAVDKGIVFIIIPFHKQQMVDGGMEALNPAFQMVNQNVLVNAPCSVGILVDRGLSGSTFLITNQVRHYIAVLFFGGPDDREALSYALRMAEHPGNSLTVVRFLQKKMAGESTMRLSYEPKDHRIPIEQSDREKEKKLDDDLIKNFRIKQAYGESFTYTEKVLNDGEEMVEAIRSIDSIHDLFIVGRRQGMISPLTEGLTDWSECPELGAIGDFLASSDFAGIASVLVVQQYIDLSPLE